MGRIVSQVKRIAIVVVTVTFLMGSVTHNTVRSTVTVWPPRRRVP